MHTEEELKKIDRAVNHPSHYCDNASGIETITITRYLDCDCANVWKYCMRYLDKVKSDPEHATPYQDLGKAIFYLNDFLKNFTDGSGNVTNEHPVPSAEVVERMIKVADVEPVPAVQSIFNDIISIAVAKEIDLMKVTKDIEALEEYRKDLP